VAENTDLIAELDALESSRGPRAITCAWWENATPEQRDAVTRNVRRTNFTMVTKRMRALGHRVTPNGIRDHAAGTCQCQTS